MRPAAGRASDRAGAWRKRVSISKTGCDASSPSAASEPRLRAALPGGWRSGLECRQSDERPVQPRQRADARFSGPNRASARRARTVRDGERPRRRTGGNRAAGRRQMLVIADLTGRAGGQRVLAAAEISRADVEAHMPASDHSRGPDVLRPTKPAGPGEARDPAGRDRFRGDAASATARRTVRPGAGGGRAPTRSCGLPFSKEAAATARPDRLPVPHDRRALAGYVGREPCLHGWKTGSCPFRRETRGHRRHQRRRAFRRAAVAGAARIAARSGRLAPTHFEAPTGQRHPIQYDGDEPVLSIRVQELFGLKTASGDWRRPAAVASRTDLARPPADSDDARPAGLLGRALGRMCAPTCAGAIPETPLAGGSGGRAADDTGKTTWYMKARFKDPAMIEKPSMIDEQTECAIALTDRPQQPSAAPADDSFGCAGLRSAGSRSR